MFSLKLSVIFLVILEVLHTTSGQYAACKTPSKTPGQCVPLNNCRNIKATLEAGNLQPSVERYIRRSRCTNPAVNGYSVCCELDEITSSSAPSTSLLNLETCGDNTGDRIHGGNNTKVFEYPWMAMLRYETSEGIKNQCGGTLINERYVLTAAHCIRPHGAELKEVRLGEHNLDTDIDCIVIGGERDCARPVQDIPVESTVIHSSYNKPKNRMNDIALIRLARPADLTQRDVVPICLPVTDALRNFSPSKYVVTGWGITENKTSSRVLLQAVVPHYDSKKCKTTLRVDLPPTQFCAGGDNKVDNCQGDSGGPLQFPADLNGQKYVQFGIVSYGQRSCGEKNVPGVYTKVGQYVEWILENMRP